MQGVRSRFCSLRLTAGTSAGCVAESLSTLKFANRAKSIKNAARLNEDVDQRTLLRKYERELKRLRAELLARQASLVDSRRLLAVRPRPECSLSAAWGRRRVCGSRSRDTLRNYSRTSCCVPCTIDPTCTRHLQV